MNSPRFYERGFFGTPEGEGTHMKKRSRKFTYIGLGIVAIMFAAACVLSWTLSRLDPLKVSDIGTLWFAAGGFVASAVSVIFLVWTLYEQRKLTQHVSRAYVGIKSVHAQVMAEDEDGQQINVTIVLHNNGETPALNIHGSLTLTCSADSERPDEGGTYEGFTGSIPEIPAKGTYKLVVYGTGKFPNASDGKQTGWRHILPKIGAKGFVRYNDVFSDETRVIKLEVDSGEIAGGWFKYPIELSGPHNYSIEGSFQPSHYRQYMIDDEKERQQKLKEEPIKGRPES